MSAGAVELRNEIGKAVGTELPGTLVFDYPTVAAISTMLAAKSVPAASATASSSSRCG
jgi:acyl carrier protein